MNAQEDDRVGLFRLDGRVALVTGGASGIGAGIVSVLARAGADVVIPYYAPHSHDVQDVVREVQKRGRRAIALEADVADAPSVERAVDVAVEEFGRIDIVVANAAIAPSVAALDLTDDDWRAIVEVNLLGVFRSFRAALPHMLQAKWGRLLATSSTAGAALGWLGHVHYTATKSGLIGLVRSLCLEVGPHGVTVNAVVPGLVPTPTSLDPSVSLGPEAVQDFVRHVPVGRNGRPEDIGAACAFLASEEAAFVTGQTLVVDGGMTVNPPA